MEQKQGGPYKTFQGIIKYDANQYAEAVARIDKRVLALRNGEVKTSKKVVISGIAVHDECGRLEDLKNKLKQAVEKGEVETKLLDEIRFF